MYKPLRNSYHDCLTAQAVLLCIVEKHSLVNNVDNSNRPLQQTALAAGTPGGKAQNVEAQFQV